MGSLYVDSKVEEIRADGLSLTLYAEGKLQGRVPVVPLERVVIQGNVQVHTKVLHLLAERRVAVHFLSGRHGRWRASLVGPEHAHAALRVAQVKTHLDPEGSAALARGWVRRKIEGQLENVALWLGGHVPEREALFGARVALEGALGRVAEAGVDSLLGIEGSAARAYFGGIAAVVPASFGFSGRNRRPPMDPVNALLSLTYTILCSEWSHQARLAGFDPHVGFLHAVDYGRESLALDFLEPWRPRADRWVVESVKEGRFRPDDFAVGGERAGCWLKNAARRRYYLEYEVWAGALRTAWRDEAYALARELLGGEWPPRESPDAAGEKESEDPETPDAPKGEGGDE